MNRLKSVSATPIERLRAISQILLDPAAVPVTARDAAHALTDLFAELGGFAEDAADRKDLLDTHTPHGKAIAAINAARCVWEYQRTAKFLQGVYAALREAQRRFPNQRIEVLYAGTGPYATLAIPLLPFFAPEEVGFTLLDLHRQCLDSVERLLDGFGFREFVRKLVECDATRYRHPPDCPLHMLVTETMQKALAQEPQVAITLNLAPQLAKGGILVPERVQVKAALADPRREIVFHDESGETQERLRVDLGQVFELSLDTVPTLAAETPAFPWVPLAIPSSRPAQAQSFLLLTHIDTFGDIRLGDYECSLNCPVTIRELHGPPPGPSVEFRYRMGEKPGFEHRWPNPNEARRS